MLSSVKETGIFALFVYLVISIQYSLCEIFPAECEIPKKEIYSSDVTVYCDGECLSFCVPTLYWMKHERKYNCTFALISRDINPLTLAEPNPNLNVELSECNLKTAQVLASIEYIGLKPHRKLILNGAQLNGFDALGGYESITDLRLINVTMDDVPDENLFLFNKLTRLDLVNSSIDALPENLFQNQTELRSLHLTGNNLTSLPLDIFDSLNNLIELDLSGNGLEAGDLEPLMGLTNLRILNLSHNQLHAISSDLLESFDNLMALSLAGNNLTALPDKLFNRVAHLETLDLSANQLKDIQSDVLTDLVNLNELNLSNNQLHFDDTEQISKHFRKLYHLRANFNKNQSQIMNDTYGLAEWDDTVFWLNGNPWECDCDSQTFRYVQSLSIPDIADIKCTNNLTLAEQTVNCENRLWSITGFFIFIILFMVGILVIVGVVFLCDKYDERRKNRKNVAMNR